MRILMVWITAFVLLTFITVGWLVSNTLVTQIASGNAALIGSVGSEGFNLAKLIEYVNILWGPVLDLLVVIWAIAHSVYRDVASEVYSY